MQKQIQKIIFLSIFLCSITILGKADSIVIVKNHQSQAIIVLSDSASQQIKNAANFLQNFIRQSTNAILPISNHVQTNTVSIHIGVTDYVKKKQIDLSILDEDGFILQQTDAFNFIIVGGSDWGTEFGVYFFLERYVGIHWLMPSEVGTDIPLKATIAIPNERKIENPVFLERQISPSYIEWKDVFSVWSRFNAFKSRISFGHNLLNLFDAKEFLNTNPNFYPLVNGKRIIPKDSQDYKWQPNFSAPGIADSAAAKIVRYFNKHPEVKSYSLGMNDFTTFDQSAQSLARRSGRKNYLGWEDVSDDYFEWVNQVAKKVLLAYPNKYFGLLAYNNTAEPPSSKIGVSKNVIPFLTYERLRWSDPPLENQGHQLTQAWEKVCTSLGWYDYVYGLNYLVPRVWFHEMRDYLNWGAKHKVKYYYAELYPNWGEGPKPWILGKLLWNPNYNVDSLLNVWYVSFAGAKAAPKLKAFYTTWEVFWTKDIFLSKWNSDNGQYLPFNNFGYLDAVPQEYVTNSDKLINDAYSLAVTDLQKKRIAKLMEMWNIYKTAINLYQQSTLPANQKQQALTNSPQFIALLNQLENDSLHSPSIQRIKFTLKIK